MTDNGKIGAVMVVGGGITGMQSALDLAEAGFKVYLIEKSPSIGGTMAQLDKTFPTNDCSMCILAPKMADCYGNQNIEVITCAELTDLRGDPGNFSATVYQRPRYVDIEKCAGCGECMEKCPTTGISHEWEMGLTDRSAIYVPFPQAVPRAAIIDEEHCRYLNEGKCGVCKKICQVDAINFEDEPKELDIGVGAVILSPGFETFDASLKKEYGYGQYRNVVTSMQFERMMSACGPSEGKIKRPSDGEVPAKVAFLQCVGSRDEKVGNPYCSSVCCMYAFKESIIAKEHSEGLQPTIFAMDVRAVGKEFEDYVIKAEEEYDIRVVRGTRVASVEEIPETNNLLVRYSQGGDLLEEEFELVVLSVGICGNGTASELKKATGIELNEYGFCTTGTWTPLHTSREGVFVSGAFSGPKDIPTSVAEASGAAAEAASIVAEERDTLTTEREYPEPKDVSGQEPRIGTFVCHCGINIGDVVDVPSVAQYAQQLPDVVHAEDMLYTCSQDSLSRIREVIHEKDLNRVVVASCSPRTHESLFQDCLREGGLNPYLFEMANIRDQCSWVHMKEPEKATEKAKDLVRMAVSKARLLEPLEKAEFSLDHSATVIGGGLAGMTAALEMATQGFEVDLIEKSDSLGGNLSRVSYGIGGKTGSQAVDELVTQISNQDNITVHLGMEAQTISGYIGNFNIHLPDGEIETGVIVVATGAQEYRPTEYFYGEDERVLTQLELAEHLASSPLEAETVAMIQCVGSRNEENPMCSRLCCSTALRNAIDIREANPRTEVYVFFKDIRTYGFREELYRKASELGVKFIRMDNGEMPELTEDGEELILSARDCVLGETVAVRPDLVALSTGIRPNLDNKGLSQMMKVSLSKDDFFLEAHQKLRPLDFSTPGIFLAGLAHWPKFADESIAQAAGAAARAITVITRDHLEGEAAICEVNHFKCRGCGRCEEACSFKAARVQEVSPGEFKCVINPSVCKGCAVCAVTCCNGAITAKHFTNQQILNEVETMIKEVI